MGAGPEITAELLCARGNVATDPMRDGAKIEMSIHGSQRATVPAGGSRRAALVVLLLSSTILAQRHSSRRGAGSKTDFSELLPMPDGFATLVGAELAGWKARPEATGKAIADQMNAGLSKPSSATNTRRSLLQLYGPSIATWYRNIDRSTDPTVIFSRELEPVNFLNRDGDLVLYIAPMRSDADINTLRTTERTRAARIVTAMLLPALRQFPAELYSSSVGYAAICAGFTKRDFSNERDEGDGEMACLVSPVSAVRKLAKNAETEEEFVSQSDVYSASGNAFAKITIKLE